MLSLAVCLRFCPDIAQLRADGGVPRLADAPVRISTLDEHALEAAVQLKERHGGRVTVVALVEREPPRELVLRALAMGADQAHLLLDDTLADGDALATATVLATALRGLGPFDLILCGEGTIDRFDQQVGPRIAEALGLPSVTYASRVAVDGAALEADRLLEDRLDTVRCPLPALVTVGQEAPAPRLPSVLQVLGAGRKPIVVRRVADLPGLHGASARTLAGSQQIGIRAASGERRGLRLVGDGPDDVARQLARRLVADGVVRRS